MDRNRPGKDHSLGEIVGGLANDVQDLVKGEIALARAELEQKLHRLLGALLWVLGGSLVGFAGLVVLLQGGAAALAMRIPAWAALATVGVVIIIIGAALARLGFGMLTLKTLAPERTAANLQKDARMMKEHTT
jgi:uncharacterized membrane protein YqjE